MDTKSVFKSVTFWGLMITLLASLLGRYGYTITDEMKNEGVKVMTQIVEFAGLVIALAGRWKATKPLSVTGTGTGDGNVTPPPRTPGFRAVALPLALSISMVSGCASLQKGTPLTRVAEVEQLYTATLLTINNLHEAGLISDEDLVQINTFQDIAEQKLNAAKDAALEGRDQTVAEHMRDFNSALDKLIEWRVRAERKE